MRGAGSVAQRLRDYVRQRVRRDGSEHVRGTASALARRLGKPTSWVSEYTDDPPIRHADIDTAIAICDFFGVSLYDFRQGHAPKRAIAPPAKSSPHITRGVKLLEGIQSEQRRQRAVWLIGLVAAEDAGAQLQELRQPRSRTPAAAKRREPGTP